MTNTVSPVGPRSEHSGYFPNTETLAKDEMRCTVLGSGMPNQRMSQASASWLVELGNGDKFIFDLGSGAASRLGALEIPYDWVDKVFITHLHQDHIGDIPGLWIGGWTGGRHGPLRVWGPSGATKETGTQYMMDGFRQALNWDIVSRNGEIAGGGGKYEVHEFDYREENQVVYEENDVVIKSFPAVHAIDGSVSYRLEWNGLSFVFSGDTYPNKWYTKFAKGADIAVHECFPTMDQLVDSYKFPPLTAINVAIHVHTSPQAFGAIMNEVKPRLAVAWHFYNDPDTRYGVFEGVRDQYKGPLSMADDLIVYNVTKDEIKMREVVVSQNTWPAPSPTPPDPADKSLLTPRSKEIDAGANVELVEKVMGPSIADFKKRKGLK